MANTTQCVAALNVDELRHVATNQRTAKHTLLTLYEIEDGLIKDNETLTRELYDLRQKCPSVSNLKFSKILTKLDESQNEGK